MQAKEKLQRSGEEVQRSLDQLHASQNKDGKKQPAKRGSGRKQSQKKEGGSRRDDDDDGNTHDDDDEMVADGNGGTTKKGDMFGGLGPHEAGKRGGKSSGKTAQKRDARAVKDDTEQEEDDDASFHPDDDGDDERAEGGQNKRQKTSGGAAQRGTSKYRPSEHNGLKEDGTPDHRVLRNRSSSSQGGDDQDDSANKTRNQTRNQTHSQDTHSSSGQQRGKQQPRYGSGNKSKEGGDEQDDDDQSRVICVACGDACTTGRFVAMGERMVPYHHKCFKATLKQIESSQQAGDLSPNAMSDGQDE
jgi:hypothetical protein